MVDVYVTESPLQGMGLWLYQVWVEGRVFTSFESAEKLTWSEQADVEAGFREAFDGWPLTAA